MTPLEQARNLTDAISPNWRHMAKRVVEQHEARIAEIIEQVVVEEREACALLAEEQANKFDPAGIFPRVYRDFAELIRARGSAGPRPG